ncbi:MAG: rhodanese-like domain-containing protein [Planctomycetaceae bacterium]
MNTISPVELNNRLNSSRSNIELIDVRTPLEFREIHATAAMNIPLTHLDPALFRDSHSNDNPLYVICKSGSRGKQACEQLAAAGICVVNVEGGTKAWEDAGLPVVRGRKAMSLERQVRIAAGALVLTGAILAVTVHPYFLGLSAFVGAGLIFSGITDSCAMGMLIARMPWNQVHAAPPTASKKSTSCQTESAPTGSAPTGSGCCE